MIEDAEFARRIRAARAYLGLNLEEASKALGLSPHQLSRRERADKTGMGLDVSDRFHLTSIYADLTGWPTSFFTDDEIPLLRPEGGQPDLSPLEVVERIERDRDEPEEGNGRG